MEVYRGETDSACGFRDNEEEIVRAYVAVRVNNPIPPVDVKQEPRDRFIVHWAVQVFLYPSKLTTDDYKFPGC
jgi:hypothetical protein